MSLPSEDNPADFNAHTSLLAAALSDYDHFFASFFNDPTLHELANVHLGREPFIPDSRYLARASIPVFYQSKQVADLAVLLLKPNQGTGKFERFKLPQIQMPESLIHASPREGVFPRDKPTDAVEFAFPLYAAIDDQVAYGAMCLDLIVPEPAANPTTLAVGTHLGLTPDAFLAAIQGKQNLLRTPEKPRIQYTLNEKGRWNCHATFYDGNPLD